MGSELLKEDRERRDGSAYIYWSIGSVFGEASTDAEAWEAMARALGAERDAAVSRAEAAEGLVGRRGAIKVTGNRNDGWRGNLVDPDDNGYWFRTAGYDSRDAVVVTLVHWAVVNNVAVVG
jgi:hypothetical protein